MKWYHLLLILLLSSCSLFRPRPADLSGNSSPEGRNTIASDSTILLNIEKNDVSAVLLPPLPAGLTPRQQRKFLRVASRAQARVARAQKPAVPLISTVKVKDKSDNRGSQGGSYAPKSKAPVAAGGSTATQTETSSLNWLWWLLIAGIVWMVWRARADR